MNKLPLFDGTVSKLRNVHNYQYKIACYMPCRASEYKYVCIVPAVVINMPHRISAELEEL